MADIRESPSLKLIELLESRGADVAFHDPHVPEIAPTREHPGYAGRRSVPLSPEMLAGVDAVLIATDHDAVDFGTLASHAKLIIDTRNAMRRRGLSMANVILS